MKCMHLTCVHSDYYHSAHIQCTHKLCIIIPVISLCSSVCVVCIATISRCMYMYIHDMVLTPLEKSHMYHGMGQRMRNGNI